MSLDKHDHVPCGQSSTRSSKQANQIRMRILPYLLPVLITLSVMSGHCQATSGNEIRYFDIRFAGIKIGELTATRTARDSITLYSLESVVNLWLATSIEMHHRIETEYRGKKLFSSTSISRVRNDTYISTTQWRDGHYQTKVDSHKNHHSNPIYSTVECSIARLYFEEPVNVRWTLADSRGVLNTVNHVRSGDYEVSGDGNTNKFSYENGSLVRASIFSTVRYEVVARK